MPRSISTPWLMTSLCSPWARIPTQPNPDLSIVDNTAVLGEPDCLEQLDLANGMKQGEAYAFEYNEITDCTGDHAEFMALLRELDEQADPYITDKTRDMYGFEDDTVVFFTGEYARWGKPEEESVES